jgi:hypothetical protein
MSIIDKERSKSIFVFITALESGKLKINEKFEKSIIFISFLDKFSK